MNYVSIPAAGRVVDIRKAPPDDARLSDIERLAQEVEPSVAKAIQQLLRDHADAVNLDALEVAIRARNLEEVLRIIGAVDPITAADATKALQDAVWAGGGLAQKSPVLREARFVFNRLNPALISWLEGYSLNLIRGLTRDETEVVRGILVKGMTEGRNPIDQARQIKTSIGLTEGQARAVANYRRELEGFHLKRSAKSWGLGNERSTVNGRSVDIRDAKGEPKDGISARRLRDQRWDGVLQRAMEKRKPIPPAQIEKMVAAYHRRSIQNRARNIARTESIRATNAGVFDAWRQAAEQGIVDVSLLRKQWLLSRDERTCPRCNSIPPANPKVGVGLYEDFQVPGEDPVKLPPLHPSCRCTVFIRLYEPIQLQEF